MARARSPEAQPRVDGPPSRLGQLHRDDALGVERVVDEDVLEPPRTLQPLEAAGQPERRDPSGEVFEPRRVGRVFGDQGPGGAEADPRVQAADVHERGGGDQLVAQLLVAVGLEEGQQPVGEIGGPGGVGGHEELDDPQLGLGHGRSPSGPNGSRSPVSASVYLSIVSIGSPRLQAVGRRASSGRPPTGSLALTPRDADLDPPRRHLGVLLLADEVDLGGPDIGMAGEFPDLVQSTVTMHLR